MIQQANTNKQKFCIHHFVYSALSFSHRAAQRLISICFHFYCCSICETVNIWNRSHERKTASQFSQQGRANTTLTESKMAFTKHVQKPPAFPWQQKDCTWLHLILFNPAFSVATDHQASQNTFNPQSSLVLVPPYAMHPSTNYCCNAAKQRLVRPSFIPILVKL